MRWIRRGSVLAVLLIGWVFILVTNNFYITTPVVFVGLGYLAAVAAIYTLYRTGSTAVMSTDEEDDDLSWGKPLGALGELEREKRTLLKAIKETEFDHQMGKLSKADADSMIAVYRARAIEVIKEIDVQNSASGKPGSVRDRILREARARIAVEQKHDDVKKKGARDDKKPGKHDRRGGKASERAEGDAKKAADKAGEPAASDGDATKAGQAEATPADAGANVEDTKPPAETARPPSEAKAEQAGATNADDVELAKAKTRTPEAGVKTVIDAVKAEQAEPKVAGEADAKAEQAGSKSEITAASTEEAAAKSEAKPEADVGRGKEAAR